MQILFLSQEEIPHSYTADNGIAEREKSYNDGLSEDIQTHVKHLRLTENKVTSKRKW